MKYWKLLFVSIAIVLSNLSFALEEPPGTQSQEDADAYFEQLEKDRAEGKIFFDKGIEKSWDESRVYVPGSFFEKSISNLKLEKKYPVVIYLHGCNGITSFNDTRWGKFISEMGFVAILPDSLARPGRISNCDPSTTSTSHRFPMALPYREQEIFYAINELKKMTWVDSENIFLMGHSEGANAVAITKAKGVRGVILSSGYCKLYSTIASIKILSASSLVIMSSLYLFFKNNSPLFIFSFSSSVNIIMLCVEELFVSNVFLLSVFIFI